MSSQVQNWRNEINASDYFGNQKKATVLADRRPVIRRPSDIVGPGIATSSIRVTDFSDLLATYDGFFSYEHTGLGDDALTYGAPVDDEDFALFVSSDSLLGGVQLATSLTTNTGYHRVFNRNPMNPDFLSWSAWVTERLDSYSPDWEPIMTFASGYGVNSVFGYALAYRVWPYGRVEWRGGVRATSGDIPHGAILFTVPPDGCPAEMQEFAAAISSQTDAPATARVEIDASGDVQVYLGSVTASPTPWVTLDGIAYDLT